MKINITEITRLFSPTFSFTKAYKHLRMHGGVDFNNDALYAKAAELAAKAETSFEDRWDTTWKYFYLPMKRKGRMICSPFSLNLHRGKAYSISFYGFTSGGYHGIYLYPPEKDDSFFRLSVADPFYNREFVRMAAALVEHHIPFETNGLDEALKYLTRESDMEVNTGSMRNPTLQYKTSRENRKRYFPHIRWDEGQVLKWK